MQAILCQTRFESIRLEAGIGVCVASLNPNADYAITLRIGDNVQVASINRENRTETYPVYFGSLENGARYEVQCRITENDSAEVISIPMYAQTPDLHTKSAQRPKGAFPGRQSSAHKGVGF